MRIRKFYLIFAAAYVTFVLYIIVINGLTKYGMLNVGDTPPFYKSAETYLELLYTSWINGANGAGFYGYPGHGNANYLLFWILGYVSHGDMIIAQRIYVLLPLFVSPISIYILSSRFLKHEASRIASTLIYSFNFVSVQYFLGFYTLYQFYALLPAILYSQYSLMERPSVLNVIKLALLVGLADILWVQSILILIPWFIILLIVHLITNKDRHKCAHSLIALIGGVVFAVLGLGLVSYIQPLSNVLIGKSPSIYAVPITAKFVIEELVYSFHNEASINNGLFLTFMAAPALLLLFYATKLKQRPYIFEFSLIFSLFSLYYFIATSTTIPESFALLVAMLALTEPWKVQLSLVLCLSILLGSLFDYLLDSGRPHTFRFVRWSYLRYFLFVTLLLSLLIGNFAHNYYSDSPTIGIITGYNPYRPGNVVVNSSFYEIRQLVSSLVPSNIPYRILWLPLDPYTDSLVNPIFYRDQVVPSWSPSVKAILEPVIDNSTVTYGHIIGLANVRVVVVDTEPSSSASPYLSWYEGVPRLQQWGLGNVSAWYAIGSPKYYVAFMNKQTDLRPVYSSKQFIIYENLAYSPVIQAYPAYTVIQKSIIDNTRLFTYSRNLLSTSLRAWIVQGGSLNYSVETPNGIGYSMMAVNNGSKYFLVEQHLKVENDTQYIFSGWIAANQVVGSSIQIAFFNSEGKRIGMQTVFPWISGDVRWTSFTKQIIPPTNTSTMAIYLWPGLRGATFYYNLSLVEGYMIRYNVSSAEVYSEVSQLTRPINFSNTFLTLNENTSNGYIGNITTLYPYFPDQSLIPMGGRWLHGPNGSVVVAGRFAADLPIYVAHEGNYQILITGVGVTDLKLSTETGKIELLELNNSYVMSRSFYLHAGKQDIYLSSSSSGISLNLILVIKTDSEITYQNLLGIVDSKFPISAKFVSLTEYFVELPSHTHPVLVFMGQTYNPHWMLADNLSIYSQPLEGVYFTGNSFLINSSASGTVYRLIFVSNWPTVVNIWLGLWSATIAALVTLYVTRVRKG